MVSKAEGADAVVALDGSGNFSSINDAVAAAPSASARHVIYIKAGLYKEVVRIGKSNITLQGDGLDKTVISGKRCYADTHDTADTAIVGSCILSALAANIHQVD